jgi:hypothetical protein
MADVTDPFDDTREGEGDDGDTRWAPIPKAPRRRSVIDSGPMKAKFRVLRAAFRRRCAADRTPCHLCGGDVDYSLPSGLPESWELDHYEPVSTHPELALIESNFRSSHRLCNQRKAARTVDDVVDLDALDCGVPSEAW